MKQFVLVLTLALLIGGCSISVGFHDVKPEHIPTAKKKKNGSVGTIHLSIEKFYITLEGFSFNRCSDAQMMYFTDDNGLTLLDAWEAALRSSIAESQLFNNSDDIKYDIQIVIMEIIHPEFGHKPTTIKAHYKILNKDKLILEETINCTWKADERISGFRNAVRLNIELFIGELLKNSDKF